MRKTLLALVLILALSGCSNAADSMPSPTTMASPTASSSATPTESEMAEAIDRSAPKYKELLEQLSDSNNDYRYSILSILMDEGNLTESQIDALYEDIEKGGVEMLTDAYYLYLENK